jgi:hypothetical protein
VTRQAIIKAILAGERRPRKLAALRDPRVKASEEQIVRNLEGNWQEDLLFVLQQEQDGYEFCQEQMAECGRQLEQYLHDREDRSQGAPLPEETRKGRQRTKKGNAPQFDLRSELFRMSGADLTQIDGIDVMTATTILSGTGWDMSKWPDEKHFVSWLRLCPDNRISGNKIIGKGRLPTINAAIELSKGNSTQAVELLEATAPYELGATSSVNYLYPACVRGQAYLLAHDASAAAAEFQKMLDHRGIVANFVTGSLAHLQIGRAYAMAGDTAKAKAAYQDFLTLWKNADPDIPILREAKGEYAKLK